MNPHDFWQRIHPPGTFAPSRTFTDVYPAVFDDGRQLPLPIRALPDGKHAVASLIINQASFAVVEAIATDLADKLRRIGPEIVVGVPTLGLTLAAAVAQRIGHARYIPLGTSRKFWYQEELSVALSSITSPDIQKRLYIDPRMVALLHGRRVALIDDVISSGVSLAAAIRLLALCGCAPLAFAVAMVQSDRWRGPLGEMPTDRILSTVRTPLLTRNQDGTWSA
jgi:adenine/guanine phosphoribosyltransferase-like PRPP-binding protein